MVFILDNELIKKDNIDQYIKNYMDNAKDDTPEGWVVRFLDVYDAYMTMMDHPGIVPNDFEDYQAALKEFFNFVAEHCWDWGD